MTYFDRSLHETAGVSLREVPCLKTAVPFYLVDDMASARRRFAALGFELSGVPGKAGCVGMKAGASEVMLQEAQQAELSLPSDLLAALKRGPALYVWVDSIDETRARLADPVIGEMVTGYGTWELFVESRIGLIIFAEKLSK